MRGGEGENLEKERAERIIEERSKLAPLKTARERHPAQALPAHKGCSTLYEGVGSVKRHLHCASRGACFFFLPERIFSLSFISTKARSVNPAVESGSTNHLFGHLLPTMIRCSDAAIARGSKAPNPASDELAFLRVPPGCLACEPAARNLLHCGASSTYAQPTSAR
jgi:hypothetical protein